VGLYRRCQTALEEAEMRVRLLTDPQDPSSAEPYPDSIGPDA
jgi:exodeoxyribonuclease VII small subunit